MKQRTPVKALYGCKAHPMIERTQLCRDIVDNIGSIRRKRQEIFDKAQRLSEQMRVELERYSEANRESLEGVRISAINALLNATILVARASLGSAVSATSAVADLAGRIVREGKIAEKQRQIINTYGARISGLLADLRYYEREEQRAWRDYRNAGCEEGFARMPLIPQ